MGDHVNFLAISSWRILNFLSRVQERAGRTHSGYCSHHAMDEVESNEVSVKAHRSTHRGQQ